MPTTSLYDDETRKKSQDIQTNGFMKRLVHNATLASNNLRDAGFNLAEAEHMSSAELTALGTKEGLQTMLAAQMLSIHHLQQKSMSYANNLGNLEFEKYHTNTALKLSNCFVQQANLLARLQGYAGQKITVERVDVHQGGQAIVGNIQGGMDNIDKNVKTTS